MSFSASSLFSFDIYNQSEPPNFYLANPDGVILYNLGTIHDRKFQLRFNSISTLTFTAPSQVDGILSDYYPFIEYRRLINVENVGIFMITNVEINNDGIVEEKDVTCKSLEVIFSYKKLSLFEGQYTFNNTIYSGSVVYAKNLMQELLAYAPGWTLGHVDLDLNNITRTYSVTDKSIYDFLVTDVSQTCQAVFVFDSLTKTISAYSSGSATTPTDIYISFDNLMKSVHISQSTEELVTALNVFGGDGIFINNVNPIGGNTIYNFDYYKNSTWMSQELQDAITNWETLISANQESYANYMTQLRIQNANLHVYEVDLSNAQSSLASHTAVRDVRIQQGLDVTEVSGSIVVDNANIATANANISTVSGSIVLIQAQIDNIHTDCSFETNFSGSLADALNNFIIGNTYTNTNYIRTSIMGEEQVQDICQELYNQAKDVVLPKVAEPRYSFEIDAANFLFIRGFEPFIDQIALGCTITIELSTSASVSAILLGFDFNYENPEEFKMILSNRVRLDDEAFQYSDLYSTTVDAGVTTNFNSQKWSAMANSYSNAIANGQSFVLSNGYVSGSHIAIFSAGSGVMIEDKGALYISTGSFTPYLWSSGETFTHTVQAGTYSIIGKIVFVSLKVTVTGRSGTLTNVLYISGLPVTAKKATTSGTFIQGEWSGDLGTGFSGKVSGYLFDGGVTSLALYKSNQTGIYNMLGSDVSSGGCTIWLNGFYFTD